MWGWGGGEIIRGKVRDYKGSGKRSEIKGWETKREKTSVSCVSEGREKV